MLRRMQPLLRMAHLIGGAIAAVAGSLLSLASALMLFIAFFAEPMAGRWPGHTSGLGLFALS